MRRMSCSMTTDAVRDHTKTVTRRHIDTWKTLKAGDRLTLIEKGMGLAKGEQQVVLAEVEIVDVRVEPITAIFDEEGGVEREGARGISAGPEGVPSPNLFAYWWAEGHGYGKVTLDQLREIRCRRIEWRYLDDREEPR